MTGPEEDVQHVVACRLSDYEVGAAKLQAMDGQVVVGLMLRRKDGGPPLALQFDSDPQLCEVMALLMGAAKEVWPRGWEAGAEKKRAMTAGPKATRGLETEATVPVDTFTAVNGDGDAWRVALMSVPAQAPPNAMVVTVNMPCVDLKPVALVFTHPIAARSFLAGIAESCERLWPAKQVAPPGRRGSSMRPRRRGR